MFGLTAIGLIHTFISLIAVGAGLASLVTTGFITSHTTLGRDYLWTTALTALTGFGIYQHGGFGKPHALGVATLIVLLVAWLAGTKQTFGAKSRYVEAVGYSLTMFFHFVPAVTETGTRLPAASPLFSSPDDPHLQAISAALFAVFLIGATLQCRALSRRSGAGEIPVST